jgi:hypothetical protein
VRVVTIEYLRDLADAGVAEVATDSGKPFLDLR